MKMFNLRRLARSPECMTPPFMVRLNSPRTEETHTAINGLAVRLSFVEGLPDFQQSVKR